jgi:uncharacterized membrane protein YfcA
VSGGDVALVVVAMFVSGFLNAAAGGGSLVSFPALVATGLPSLTANVTNTLALWPGYLGGAASLSGNLERGVHLRQLCLAAAVGAVAGSVGLLVVDPDLFDAVVPFLVLMAAGLLAVPSHWVARLRPPEAAETEGPRPLRPATLLVVGLAGAYGAYFGGALGVILLAVLNAFIGGDIRGLNATKSVLSLLTNTVALVAFVGFAPVAWDAVAVGAPASLAGGLVGGWGSTRLDAVWLRRGIIAYALVAGLVMLVT